MNWMDGIGTGGAPMMIAYGLFGLGVVAAVVLRQPWIRLAGALLMLAAAEVNLLSFSTLTDVHGEAFAIFLIVDAVAVTVVTLGILGAQRRG